ncbi:MAG: hypothetical protein DRQ49_10935 [Gammaproteobacteria bacterium]|nr:MAG: hypothetical protein DRQ49_10935 [Gammaproteobacteria bacterium]RKZ44566.1 MAG: hypothetical protein DRQ41_02455 [Gammaproteobacteria bacterium]RKZ74153.1 MAG: hypothetical protein DRQ57_11995 [Gammaproteobacteria bacterium]
MKSSFDFEIHSSRFVTTRRRSKIRLWFLLILSLAIAGYFVVPKLLKLIPKVEEKVENNVPKQPAVKEQIIKTIPLPDK